MGELIIKIENRPLICEPFDSWSNDLYSYAIVDISYIVPINNGRSSFCHKHLLNIDIHISYYNILSLIINRIYIQRQEGVY